MNRSKSNNNKHNVITADHVRWQTNNNNNNDSDDDDYSNNDRRLSGRVLKVRGVVVVVVGPERVWGFAVYCGVSFRADGKTFHGSQGRDGWRLPTVRRVEDQLCE